MIKKIVLAAVTQNGQALQYASDNLKTVEEIVLTAAKQNNFIRENISLFEKYDFKKFKNKKELMKVLLLNGNYNPELPNFTNYFISNDMIPSILEKDYKYIKNLILESKNLEIENEKELFEKIIKKYPEHLNEILYYVYLNYLN